MAHRAFGRDIIYTIILYYILLYIELWELQTTITFSSMLQFTPDCTALSLTVERWLAVTLHMSLSGHAVERWLAVITWNSCQSWNISTRVNLSRHKSSWTRLPVHGESVARQIKTCRRFSLAKYSPDTRPYVHLYGILSPRRVWCERKKVGNVAFRMQILLNGAHLGGFRSGYEQWWLKNKWVYAVYPCIPWTTPVTVDLW